MRFFMLPTKKIQIKTTLVKKKKKSNNYRWTLFYMEMINSQFQSYSHRIFVIMVGIILIL